VLASTGISSGERRASPQATLWVDGSPHRRPHTREEPRYVSRNHIHEILCFLFNLLLLSALTNDRRPSRWRVPPLAILSDAVPAASLRLRQLVSGEIWPRVRSGAGSAVSVPCRRRLFFVCSDSHTAYLAYGGVSFACSPRGGGTLHAPRRPPPKPVPRRCDAHRGNHKGKEAERAWQTRKGSKGTRSLVLVCGCHERGRSQEQWRSTPAANSPAAPSSSASASLSASRSRRSRSSHSDASLSAPSSAGTSIPTSAAERKSNTAWMHLPSARRPWILHRGRRGGVAGAGQGHLRCQRDVLVARVAPIFRLVAGRDVSHHRFLQRAPLRVPTLATEVPKERQRKAARPTSMMERKTRAAQLPLVSKRRICSCSKKLFLNT